MRPERWHRIKDVLSLALKRPPAERASALDDACRDDPSLRPDVEAFLQSEQEMSSGFLEAPLAGPEAALEDDSDDDASVPLELLEWTRYQNLTRIGRGGMATVYKAWDPQLRRTVAIKLISGRDPLTIKRFLREAETQAGVEHDHVLKVYETGELGHHHYIAMQYVNGPTLLGVRDDTTLDQKVELMLKIADGLQAAHGHGLVHRDIKPGNILIEESAEGFKPYVLDFGLAVEVGAPALTKTGVVMGTPRYMAPERIHGGAAALDRRSDIYSLGATFYEFISGTAPFASSSGLQVLVDVLESEFKPLRALQPTIAPELDAIVAKCLEKDPRLRYPSARALADDLRRYLDGDAVTARPTSRMGRLVRRARKHPRLAAAFGTMGLVMLLLAASSAYGYWRTARQTELAQRLGEEIRDVEWLYRAAQMSPLHAIEPQKQQVRQRIAQIEQIVVQAGSIASGPGHYAVGRALLALRDDATALQRLERAWAAGYRTPDAAAALGLAHDEVFRAEYAKAQQIDADAARAARLRVLEIAHREPALRYLEAGRASAIVPPKYVEALIASHRGDVNGAIGLAEAAARETPWLFEARLLQADLEFKQAVASYLKGGIAEAGQRTSSADRYYADAERIAATSFDAYRGRCAVAGLALHMESHGLPGDVDATKRQAEESCARALVVEPDNPAGHGLYADAVDSWATYLVQHRQNPGDAYDRAEHLAARAMALSGDAIEPRLALASVLMNRAWWQSRDDQDPRASADRAIAMFTQALATDPRNLAATDNMGQTLLLRSRYEVRHGLDALQTLDRAVAILQKTTELDPALASAYRVLSRAAIERADEQARRGEDPTPGLTRVLQFIEHAGGNPAQARRVEAVARLRARLASTSPR